MKIQQKIIRSSEKNEWLQESIVGSWMIKYISDVNYNTVADFVNTCITKNINRNGKYVFEVDKSYYVRIPIIKRENFSQKIIVELYNQSNPNDVQRITNFTVPARPDGSEIDAVLHEFIVTPRSNYDTLSFRLVRNSNDYAVKDIKKSQLEDLLGNYDADTLPHGRIVRFNSEDKDSLNGLQIISLNTDILNGVKPVKLGVRGKSGTILVINGEEIRIGRSGIYELLNDGYTRVDSLGVYLPTIENGSSTEMIIIDYQYEDEKSYKED